MVADRELRNRVSGEVVEGIPLPKRRPKVEERHSPVKDDVLAAATLPSTWALAILPQWRHF